MRSAGLLAILLLCLAGCAVKVIPEQVSAGAVNAAEGSQTINRDGIVITARNSDTDIHSYNLEGTVSAFQVTIVNNSPEEVAYGPDSFLLLDNEGQQYFALTPEKVKEIVSRDSYYLIPYPYVGFYYLEDYEKTAALNKFNSQVPYYYEYYPQDIYTMSLPSGSIIPQAKVTGLVYFKVDLARKKGVKLLVFGKNKARSTPPDFIFPFKID